MPAATQQLVILSREPSTSNGLALIGSRTEIISGLSHYNTAPERNGDDTLHGPGIRIELPPGQQDISQMLLTVVEEEIAWQTIMRLAKAFRWKLLDTNTGRELQP